MQSKSIGPPVISAQRRFIYPNLELQRHERVKHHRKKRRTVQKNKFAAKLWIAGDVNNSNNSVISYNATT
jgi:hypothetical protein